MQAPLSALGRIYTSNWIGLLKDIDLVMPSRTLEKKNADGKAARQSNASHDKREWGNREKRVWSQEKRKLEIYSCMHFPHTHTRGDA